MTTLPSCVSAFFFRALHTAVLDRIPQVSLFLRRQDFVLTKSRHHQVSAGLQQLHLKQFWPLQHHQHHYLSIRSILTSIKHRVSAMEQLSTFSSRIGFPDTLHDLLLIRGS